jgi:hypothetical protein
VAENKQQKKEEVVIFESFFYSRTLCHRSKKRFSFMIAFGFGCNEQALETFSFPC